MRVRLQSNGNKSFFSSGKRLAIMFAFSLSSLITIRLNAQDQFESALLKRIDSLLASPDVVYQLYPNIAPGGLMVPSGYGGYGTYIFGFVGGQYPEVYTNHKINMIVAGGLSIGNPEKFVNFSASLDMGDLDGFRNFSTNFTISRSLGKGSSLSAGGTHVFAGDGSDAQLPSFHLAFSHAVQTMPSKTPGCSKLTYTIGAGTGRFWYKSPFDVANGKGKHGTGVFGGVSYELLKNTNLSVEWSGVNLGASFGITPFKIPLAFAVGAVNLTTYSADKPALVFIAGYPLSLNRNKLKSQ